MSSGKLFKATPFFFYLYYICSVYSTSSTVQDSTLYLSLQYFNLKDKLTAGLKKQCFITLSGSQDWGLFQLWSHPVSPQGGVRCSQGSKLIQLSLTVWSVSVFSLYCMKFLFFKQYTASQLFRNPDCIHTSEFRGNYTKMKGKTCQIFFISSNE